MIITLIDPAAAPRFDVDRAWTEGELAELEAELRRHFGAGNEPPSDLALIAEARRRLRERQ